jgi:hypothetical protein
MTEREIDIGDVVLDRARNKPLQVVETAPETAAEHDHVDVADAMAQEWGVQDDDRVLECVFLPAGEDTVSSPRKTYAYPEGRLTRYPTEAALDSIRTVRHPVDQQRLRQVATTAQRALTLDEDDPGDGPEDYETALRTLVGEAAKYLLDPAFERAEAGRFGGGDDGA